MQAEQQLHYQRILLKISGEALMGDKGFGISKRVLDELSNEIVEVHDLGLQLAIVVGGGNIFRGAAEAMKGMDRVTADQMGMLATLINCLALQEALERRGLQTRVLSSLDIHQVAETFVRRRAMRHLEKGRVVILAAGTGNPYFTTDSAAALRAMEIKAEVLLKATKVDGVFTSDPVKDKNAKLLKRVRYMEFLERELKVMDSTAVSLCKDNSLSIVVFNIGQPGNIRRIVLGEDVGSLISE
jgi:uridylate kinase